MNISMSQNKNYDFGQIMSLYLEMKVSKKNEMNRALGHLCAHIG